MKKPRPILWITDPWNTLDHPRETTLRLIEESLHMGIPAYWADVRTVRLENGRIQLDCQQVLEVLPGRGPRAFQLSPTRVMLPEDFSSIQFRPDPPVDFSYIHPLQLLWLAVRKRERKNQPEIVNPPQVLLCANEKLESIWFPELMPPSVVASEWETLARFGRKTGRTVLKPLHQAQSKGVELIDWSDDSAEAESRARELLTQATQDFRQPVLLQKYLRGIEQGEQRLWYLDGKLLAVVRKKPKAGEFRINIDQGASIEETRLSAREKKAHLRISRHLRSLNVRLAAVDLIEGCITDFNITSPGLLVQMEALLNRNLARVIVKKLCR